MEDKNRIHALDNIRWSVVCLVMVYHVFYMFNAEGVLGGVGPFSSIQPQDALLTLVYPWFMVVLFVLSGICSAIELEKNPAGYLRKRSRKLLPPCTLGLFVLQWVVGYYNIKIGQALALIPPFLIYPLSVLSSIGPLWFIQMLWIFDVLIWLLHKWKGYEMLQKRCMHLPLFVMFLGIFLLWGSSWIGIVPVFSMYRFKIYMFSFLCGCFVFSSVQNRKTLRDHAAGLLTAFLVLGVIFTVVNYSKDYISQAILGSFLCSASAWIAILAILGSFERWFNQTNRFAGWMSRSSWGFYVLHYICVLIPCYYLKDVFCLPELPCYLIALLLMFTLMPALNWIIVRIPGIRFAILGAGKGRYDRTIT